MKPSGKISKWENCLIAIVDRADSREVYQALQGIGLEVLRLVGHYGAGPMGALHKMERESRGELRILDGIYQELSHGNVALVVEVAPDRLSEVSEMLYRSRARSVWEFDDLTFVKKVDLERVKHSRAE